MQNKWGISAMIMIMFSMMCHKAPSREELASQIQMAGFLVQQQGYEKAMQKYIDPLIAHFEKSYGHENGLIYCANGQIETLLYLAQAANLKQKAVALDKSYAYAYYLKGYVLIEMGQHAEARPFLEKAVTLSPSDPQFLCELGNWHQNGQEWQQALSLYERAEEGAKLLEPEGTTEAQRRALRGKGFVYTELGRFDEAEEMYRSCLQLDPGDEVAAGELEYVINSRQDAQPSL